VTVVVVVVVDIQLVIVSVVVVVVVVAPTVTTVCGSTFTFWPVCTASLEDVVVSVLDSVHGQTVWLEPYLDTLSRYTVLWFDVDFGAVEEAVWRFFDVFAFVDDDDDDPEPDVLVDELDLFESAVLDFVDWLFCDVLLPVVAVFVVLDESDVFEIVVLSEPLCIC